MAVGDCVCGGVVVGLALKHADAIVQLVCDAEVLVGGCVIRVYEGRVVGRDERYIAVFSIAELGMIVAWLSVGGRSG